MSSQILLENQMIPIKVLEESMNLTEALVDTIVNISIDLAVDKSTFSLEDLIGLGGIAGSVVTTYVLGKKQANALTMIRSYGFNTGLLLGLALAFGSLKNMTQGGMSKDMIKAVARLTYSIIKKKTNLISKVSKVFNPIISKIVKIPDYNEHFKSVVASDSSFNGQELFKSYFNSLMLGAFVSVLGYAVYMYKKFSIPKTEILNYVDSTHNADKNLKSFFASSLMLNDNINVSDVLNNLKSISLSRNKTRMPDIKEPLTKLAFGITTLKTSNKKDIFKVYHKNSIYDIHDKDNEKLDLVFDRIEQAISIIANFDPNFKKFIESVYVLKANYDNAHVTFSKTKSGKFDIFIVVNKNISKWYDLDVSEIVAILLHELGHVVTGAFYIMPVEIGFYIFVSIASAFSNNFVRHLINFSIAYNIVSISRIQEMQADAYAVRRGYGDALVEALHKLLPASKELNDMLLLTTHGSQSIRIDQLSKAFHPLLKQIKES